MSGPDSGNSDSQSNSQTTTTPTGASDYAAAVGGQVSGGGRVSNASGAGTAINAENITTQNLDLPFATELLNYSAKTVDGIVKNISDIVNRQATSNDANAVLNAAAVNSAYTGALAQVNDLAKGTQTGGLSTLLKPVLYVGGGVVALVLLVILFRKK